MQARRRAHQEFSRKVEPGRREDIGLADAIRLDRAENIVVNGDTARADTTADRGHEGRVGRRDGQWNDCTPPDQA